MRDIELFQVALVLGPPWIVQKCCFDQKAGRLDLSIDFPKGSLFQCAICGSHGCPSYDTSVKTWRHLNFFQYKIYIHARVPRVQCKQCGVKRISVPWARDGSGFTLLFEAFIMAMVKQMPVRAVAREIKEHDTRLWRVIHHYVDKAREGPDYSCVVRIAFDETAAKRGHNYITVFADLDGKRVIYVTDGKGAETVAEFIVDFAFHNGDPSTNEEVCIDMSKAFINGTAENLPNAHITFDKFHAVKIVNTAVDDVRRQEQKHHPELKKTRYS